jgi:hypothetical protein
MNLQVLGVGAIACLVTGALLGSGVQGYHAQQTQAETHEPPTLEPVPDPSPTPTPQSVPAKPESSPVFRVHTPGLDGANLRDVPSLKQGYIQGILKDGTPVIPEPRSGDFVAVVTDTGVKGWLHQSTIKAE